MSPLKDLAKMIVHPLLPPTRLDPESLYDCEIAKGRQVVNGCVRPDAVTIYKAARP